MSALDELKKKTYDQMDDVEKALIVLWGDVTGYEDVAAKGMDMYAALRESNERFEGMINSLAFQDARKHREIIALRERVAALEAERNEIAKTIRVTLDDGTAPDNLVEHVQLLMIEEYDPMVKRIDTLKRQLQESK